MDDHETRNNVSNEMFRVSLELRVFVVFLWRDYVMFFFFTQRCMI